MSFTEDFDSNKKKEPRSSLSQLNPSRRMIGNLEISIERVYKKDYKRVAKTLQLAFNKDPFVNYILNTKINYDEVEEKKLIKQKNDLFQAFFEFSVLEYFSFGGVIVAIKDVQFELANSSGTNYPFLAAACWNNLKFDNSLTLNYYNFNSTSHNHSGSDNKLFLFSSFLKFSYLAYMNNCRQKTLKEKLPFLNNIRDSVLINLNLNLNFKNKFNSVWYLSDIGVSPSMAGKSLGKILINYCLDNFVLDSWCYLESSNIINRNFYTKLGFKIANTFAVNQDEIVNNIDINNKEDLGVLNSLDDFILMDAMFRPPKNINIEKINYKVADIEVEEKEISSETVSNSTSVVTAAGGAPRSTPVVFTSVTMPSATAPLVASHG
ncbi:hypothetical protein PSN45_001125 [Yamadazyma tenuis]|uniref:N-acetyltransferase domain-containing protein n=1 Tax=Candida tenuis (strain ATCC 10573 / BCRC 21748 / CBS 615 / JCM 9827 / NBRC 10315 / NRRL Y-1498 / VKM Y-70) TaxID=590646 RepID=G3B8F8_CANTC|nr:uncharacterized protein CANTEDRAFT_115847 [Yamadazyma tenuis ATCC 10573]XP_006689056.1 uncharacterized protein CANTEDRAFT_115847 [Yamadazyma tenuis ATCC 10573]EGV62885.1 hypothetical protein CANTEDRAFT_115847 [Yamadazyma tenuis ATCC 10573]EGV62886.1 hypothetical protein CANTEDRAFT_115847 [Yamadazyma tenuis ATCC 10573]WEJ93653.1 hypothetical protein PSN45_001125 [Yamadazyma tenuis]